MSGKAIGISMNLAIPVTTPALRTISWPAVC